MCSSIHNLNVAGFMHIAVAHSVRPQTERTLKYRTESQSYSNCWLATHFDRDLIVECATLLFPVMGHAWHSSCSVAIPTNAAHRRLNGNVTKISYLITACGFSG